MSFTQDVQRLGESEFGPFVASKIRRHFHRPECKWAAYLKPHKMLEFSSHAEAVAAGKKPCKTCPLPQLSLPS